MSQWLFLATARATRMSQMLFLATARATRMSQMLFLATARATSIVLFCMTSYCEILSNVSKFEFGRHLVFFFSAYIRRFLFVIQI